MTSYHGEVGLLSRAGSQEQASPCISIIPRPCSSRRRRTKSKQSLLSRTKLFNAVIDHVFFLPSPFAIGNETLWKIWCIVLHTNKGPWISLSFMVLEDRICSATMRNTFSDSRVLQARYPWYLRRRGGKSWQTAAMVGITFLPQIADFRVYEAYNTERERHILYSSNYSMSWTAAIQNRRHEQLLDTRCMQAKAKKILYYHLFLDMRHKLFDRNNPGSPHVSAHLISLFPAEIGQRKETDGGQSNYTHRYTPSCLIS